HIRVDSIGDVVLNRDTLRRQVVSMNRENYRSTYIFRGEIIEGIGTETFFCHTIVWSVIFPAPIHLDAIRIVRSFIKERNWPVIPLMLLLPRKALYLTPISACFPILF